MDTMRGYLAAVFATETARRGANYWVGKQACLTRDIRFQLGVGDPNAELTQALIGQETIREIR
jgi:hypothetical protein